MTSNIMLAASNRLKTAWSDYVDLKKSAKESGRALPSTLPMSPALGKRFMIIRQEVNSPQPGILMGMDTFARAGAHDALSASYFPES